MQGKPKHQTPKIEFTPAQTAAAIKRAKNSKAIGPDYHAQALGTKQHQVFNIFV